MAFPRPSRPRALWSDLKAFLSGQQRHKIVFGALAVMMPVIIIIGFITDARTNILPGKSVIYVESWPADRSDDVIKAQQKIDQKRRDAEALERQRAYQRLAKQLDIE